MKFLVVLFSVGLVSCSSQQVKDFLGNAGKSVSSGPVPLTRTEVVAGLKEALIVGAGQSAEVLHRADAFLGNPAIRIPFPPEAIQVKNTLDKLGMQSLTRSVVVSLNRAAEKAAIKAKPIFITAIKKMTLKDAWTILKGDSNEATQYLKRTTSKELTQAFRPSIETALSQVNATRYWGQAMGRYNQIPLVKKVNPDLTGFVTDKALEGLFLEVAKVEKDIRKDPVARVTDILKRVFGHPAAKG